MERRDQKTRDRSLRAHVHSRQVGGKMVENGNRWKCGWLIVQIPHVEFKHKLQVSSKIIILPSIVILPDFPYYYYADHATTTTTTTTTTTPTAATSPALSASGTARIELSLPPRFSPVPACFVAGYYLFLFLLLTAAYHNLLPTTPAPSATSTALSLIHI